MSLIDFTKPHRQSKTGLIVLFFDAVFDFGKAMWAIVITFLIRAKSFELGIALLIGGTLVLLFSIVAYLKYRALFFYIDEVNQEFVIHHGVLNKTKTVIQLNKIQQVNLNQNFLQQIIGVYSVQIDSAGTEDNEAKLRAISKGKAHALKKQLMEQNYSSFDSVSVNEQNLPTSDTKPFLKISAVSLFKIGITSNYAKTIGFILAFLFTIYENLKDIDYSEWIDTQYIQNEVVKSSFFTTLLFLSIVFLLIFLLNLIRTFAVFFNFTIFKVKGSLQLKHGLTNIKNTVIRPERVQIISISQNLLQRKLNVLAIKIRQVGDEDYQKKKDSAIEIPGCSPLEKDEILKLLLQDLPIRQEMLRPNYRKFVFSWFIIVGLPSLLFFIVDSAIDYSLFQYANFLFIYAIFFTLILTFGFRNYRLFPSSNFIVKQHGAWDVDTEIIEVNKIQSLTVSQLFWHKKSNIGTLHVHTAGGTVDFQLGNFDRINALVNLWLYQIESKPSSWM